MPIAVDGRMSGSRARSKAVTHLSGIVRSVVRRSFARYGARDRRRTCVPNNDRTTSVRPCHSVNRNESGAVAADPRCLPVTGPEGRDVSKRLLFVHPNLITRSLDIRGFEGRPLDAHFETCGRSTPATRGGAAPHGLDSSARLR